MMTSNRYLSDADKYFDTNNIENSLTQFVDDNWFACYVATIRAISHCEGVNTSNDIIRGCLIL